MLNPTHVDTVRAEMDGKLAQAQHDTDRATDSLHRLVGDKKEYGVWKMINRDAVEAARQIADLLGPSEGSRILAALKDLDEAREEIDKIMTAIAALDMVFDAAGEWNRFWLVPDGHVHGNRYCPTLHREGRATTLVWLPELSGHSEDEAVEEFGESMCTVCFPSAPVNPAFSGPGRRAQADLDAKAAEKAAKDADKAVKGITNPDGTELVLRGGGYITDRPKTLIAAQRLLLHRLGDITWYRAVRDGEGRTGGHPDEAGWLADAEVLIAAIAAKTDRDADEIRVEAWAKANKKTAKDMKR